jgi:membrane protease YdiL (CAAX protease family)
VSVPPWSWRVAALAVAVSFAGYWGLEALRHSAGRLWQGDVVFPDLVDSTPALCCLLYLAGRADTSVGKMFGLAGTRLRTVLVSAAGWAALEFLLTAITADVAGRLGCKPEPESENAVSVLLRLDMIILGPVCEELLFRGLLYTSLRTRLSIAPSIIVTAAAFALAHAPCSLNKLAALFVPALLSSFWYERTRSLWPNIISHSLNNLLCLL